MTGRTGRFNVWEAKVAAMASTTQTNASVCMEACNAFLPGLYTNQALLLHGLLLGGGGWVRGTCATCQVPTPHDNSMSWTVCIVFTHLSSSVTGA